MKIDYLLTNIFKRRFVALLLMVFTISAMSAQHAPVAQDDANSTAMNTTLNEPAPGVLGNDSDADGDAISVTSFVIDGTTYNAGDTASLPEGDFTLNADGSYTFVPAAGFSGFVPDIRYYIEDDETPPRSDYAILQIYVEDATDNLQISISSCNQGFIQPGSVTPNGVNLPNGAYKIHYSITFSNESQAIGYGAASQINNIQVFNDLEAAFGDETIMDIEVFNVSTSHTEDGLGGYYPQDWDMSDLDTNEFSASDADPGKDGLFLSSSVSNNILYPRQYVDITYCVYVSPDYGGDASIPARSYPDPSGSGIDFDNVVTATSSSGNPGDNILIQDFHTQEAFVAADLYIQDGSYTTYTPNYDGTYTVVNKVTIVNDGPQTANDVNFNYALGNWFDDGVNLQSVNLVLGAGSAPATLNAAFDGDSESYLLAPGQTLAPGDQIIIEIHQTFAPTTYQEMNYFWAINPSMTLGGADGFDDLDPAIKRTHSFVTWSDGMGSHVDRYYNHDTNNNPNPSSDDQCRCDGGGMRFPHHIQTYVNKTVVNDVPAASGTPGNRDITFRIRIGVDQNNSDVRLEQVKLTDDLDGICSGNIVNVGPVSITNSTAEQDPTVNSNYDGINDIEIFTGVDGIMNPGEYVEVEFTVEISDTCEGDNVAVLDGYDPKGENSQNYSGIGGSDSATISVLTPIDAVDDQGGSVYGGAGGTVVNNVLEDNGNGTDMLDEQPAQLGDVIISQVGAWPSGVHLDPNTGEVTVDPGTAPGNYLGIPNLSSHQHR
jgi:hypothetical protein